jgi:uncharacterized integral membrane protein
MRFFVTVVLLVLVFLAITFSIQNTEYITLRYFGMMNVQIAAYALIFFAFFAGVVLSGLLGLFDRIRLRRQIAKIRKELQGLENEIYNLRKGQLASEPPPALKKDYLS